MTIKRLVLADADGTAKRKETLEQQIKRTRDLLSKAREQDPQSTRVFSLKKRLRTLEGQLDNAKQNLQRQKKDTKKEDASAVCTRHQKKDCKSTMCPESPNYNVLTQI